MSENYYVRIRGEVKGPVSRSELVSQIRKKRIGRHHEVSTDAVTWMRAGDVADLFEPVVVQREQTSPADERSEGSDSRGEGSVKSKRQESASEAEWFYAKGKNRLGPVSEAELKTLLASGRVSGADLVWNDSLEDWIEAGSLPVFAGVASSPSNGNSQQSRPSDFQPRPARFFETLLGLSQGAELPNKAAWKFPNLTRYLSLAEGSLRILFVIYLVIIAAGWIYEIVLFIKLEDAFRLIVAIGSGPIAILFSWLIFLSCLAMLEVIKVMIRIEHNTDHTPQS